MAPTGAQLAQRSLSHRGVPYSANPALRFGPDFYDCSGMIHRDLMDEGVDDRGADGWTSVTFQDWITRAGGTSSSLAVARVTPGMIVCLGHVSGPAGHIALTLGNNQVLETPSAEGHQVGISPFDRNRFDFAGYIPGVVYPAGEVLTAGNAVALGQDQLSGCFRGCLTGSGCLLLATMLPAAALAAYFAHLAGLL